MGITELVDLVCHIKLKSWVFLRTHSVSMVAYYVEKKSFSQIIGHLFDTAKR